MFRSATPPKPPVAPARSAPSGRCARLLRSGEWGDLAAERQGRKNSRFQDQGARSWIHGAVSERQKRKNPSARTGSFRSRRVRALFDRVTGPKRDPATETPFQSSGIQSHSSNKIPPRTCYQWPLPVAHKRIRTIRNHELSSCWVQRSARRESHIWPSVRPRITASTPRKRRALQQWNG